MKLSFYIASVCLAISAASSRATTGPWTSAPTPIPENAKPKADPTPAATPFHKFAFVNGVALGFDAEKGVYRIDPSGNRELLISGNILAFPSRFAKTNSSAAYFLSDKNARIILCEVDDKLYTISFSGQVNELPFQKRDYKGRKSDIFFTYNYARVADAKGISYQYLVFSAGYGYPSQLETLQKSFTDITGTFNSGETYVVREDGRFLRSDFRMHADILGNEFSIENGIVSFAGNEGAREIDLQKFAKEAEFIVPKIQPPEDREGHPVDPAKFITSFSTDLTLMMREKDSQYQALDADVRDKLRRALIKRELGSAVLLGPAGSGKTELIERFMYEVGQGLIPELPRSTAFISLDAAALGAGTKYVGAMEARIDSLIKASSLRPTILVLDEIHSLAGQGTSEGNTNDFFQWLKPHLASGKVKIIGMSTVGEFHRTFSHDSALMERFQVIEQKPPTSEESIEIYAAWATKKKLPVPTREVLGRVYRNSEKFNPIGSQPRKGIRILIDAYADLALREELREPTLNDIDQATARVHNVAPADFDLSAIKRKLAELPAKLNARVIGNHAAKEVLVRQATASMVGTNDPTKPRMTALLVGPKGVGKTEVAYAYGEALGLNIERIMMNKYSAYSQPEELLLTIKQAQEKSGMTLFIVDEFDKGPVAMQNALLEILDKGRFSLPATTQHGVKIASADVSVTNASFILLGNFATHKAKGATSFGFGRGGHTAEEPGDEALRHELIQDGMPEYVLDRVQDAIFMDYIEKDEFHAILKLNVNKILKEQSAVHERPITLPDQEMLVDRLTEEYFSVGISNRTALRVLNKELRLGIAKDILETECEHSLENVH